MLIEQVDVGDIQVEAFDHGGLLFRGGGYRLVHPVNFFDTLSHADQTGTGLVGHFYAVFAGNLAGIHGAYRLARADLQ